MADYQPQPWLLPLVTSHLGRLVEWKRDHIEQLQSVAYCLKPVAKQSASVPDAAITDNGSGLIIKVDKIPKPNALIITELKTVIASYHVTLSDGEHTVAGILPSGSFRSSVSVAPAVGHVIRPSTATLHVTPMGSAQKQIRLDIKRCRHIVTASPQFISERPWVRSDPGIKKKMMFLLRLYSEEVELQKVANGTDSDDDEPHSQDDMDDADKDEFPDEGGLQDDQDLAASTTGDATPGPDQGSTAEQDVTSFATQVPDILASYSKPSAPPLPAAHEKPALDVPTVSTAALDVLQRLKVKYRQQPEPITVEPHAPIPRPPTPPRPRQESPECIMVENYAPVPRPPTPPRPRQDSPECILVEDDVHDFPPMFHHAPDVVMIDSSVKSNSPPAPTVPCMTQSSSPPKQARVELEPSPANGFNTTKSDFACSPVQAAQTQREKSTPPSSSHRPGTRRPNPKYVKYAQRRLPQSQRALLDKDSSWLPPVPSTRFPPSNVPIDVLKSISDSRPPAIHPSSPPREPQSAARQTPQSLRPPNTGTEMASPTTPTRSEDNMSCLSWSVTPSQRLKRRDELPPDSSAPEPSPAKSPRNGSDDGLQQSIPRPLLESPTRKQNSATVHAEREASVEEGVPWFEDVVGDSSAGQSYMADKQPTQVALPCFEDTVGQPDDTTYHTSQPEHVETPGVEHTVGQSNGSSAIQPTCGDVPWTLDTVGDSTIDIAPKSHSADVNPQSRPSPTNTAAKATQETSSYDSKNSPIVYVKATQAPNSSDRHHKRSPPGYKRNRPYEWSQDDKWNEDPDVARKRQRVDALVEIRGQRSALSGGASGRADTWHRNDPDKQERPNSSYRGRQDSASSPDYSHSSQSRPPLSKTSNSTSRYISPPPPIHRGYEANNSRYSAGSGPRSPPRWSQRRYGPAESEAYSQGPDRYPPERSYRSYGPRPEAHNGSYGRNQRAYDRPPQRYDRPPPRPHRYVSHAVF